MYAKLLVAILVFIFPLAAQIYDAEEPIQQTPSVVGDSITDELPAPLPEGSASKPAANSPILLAPSTDTEGGENIAVAKKLAGMGAALYFVGLGLSRGVAMPLSISAGIQHDTGLALISSIISLASDGFKISGTIRNGIGASIAYNCAFRQGLSPERNINWGFYKAGWAFSVIAGLTSLMLQFGGNDIDKGTTETISLISFTSGIAADAMWTVGVINSLKYVRSAKNNGTDLSQINIIPVYSTAQKSVGAVAVWSF